jgi:hypothetical protein
MLRVHGSRGIFSVDTYSNNGNTYNDNSNTYSDNGNGKHGTTM